MKTHETYCSIICRSKNESEKILSSKFVYIFWHFTLKSQKQFPLKAFAIYRQEYCCSVFTFWPGHWEKGTFFKALKNSPQKNVATKLEGGGDKALVATKKRTFFAASLKVCRSSPLFKRVKRLKFKIWTRKKKSRRTDYKRSKNVPKTS